MNVLPLDMIILHLKKCLVENVQMCRLLWNNCLVSTQKEVLREMISLESLTDCFWLEDWDRIWLSISPSFRKFENLNLQNPENMKKIKLADRKLIESNLKSPDIDEQNNLQIEGKLNI